ncbi:helix-turn-helix transcriptional regulator [Alteraurantiacibacter palmitatis]|uniref:Transcriptional regulator n=1 Tax=Alteraurantiacibacter palmitatis TaxID=2054628 RepID=A0ABV7E698_9SPHN
METADEYRIDDPAEMRIDKQPELTRPPGVYLREVILPQWGLTKVVTLAELLKVNRVGLQRVLLGQSDISRELAYRFGALLGDDMADFLLNYQLEWDKQNAAARREELKKEIARLERPQA